MQQLYMQINWSAFVPVKIKLKIQMYMPWLTEIDTESLEDENLNPFSLAQLLIL